MDDAIGARREVVLGLPHFQSVALAVGRSDLIATLPVQYARAVAEGTGLELFQLPIPSPAPEVRMYWHSRHDKPPPHARIRRAVAEAVAELKGEKWLGN